MKHEYCPSLHILFSLTCTYKSRSQEMGNLRWVQASDTCGQQKQSTHGTFAYPNTKHSDLRLQESVLGLQPVFIVVKTLVGQLLDLIVEIAWRQPPDEVKHIDHQSVLWEREGKQMLPPVSWFETAAKWAVGEGGRFYIDVRLPGPVWHRCQAAWGCLTLM